MKKRGRKDCCEPKVMDVFKETVSSRHSGTDTRVHRRGSVHKDRTGSSQMGSEYRDRDVDPGFRH